MHPMPRHILSLLLITVQLLFSVIVNAQNGITIKKVLDGGQGQLVANAEITVQDSIYFDASQQAKLEPGYPVKNAVTFKLNEYSPVYLPGAFTASANVRISYLDASKVLRSVDQTLAINYDTTTSYKPRNSFVFSNAHQVTVRLLSVTCSNTALIGALMLENEMNVKPVLKLDVVADVVGNIKMANSPNTDATDELLITWDAVKGADEYDLEWAYIDSTALMNNRYGNPVNKDLVFRNNASRVSVSQNTYSVPLFYDNGGVLYVRVRAAQVRTGFQRKETGWKTDFTLGKGAFAFVGHQRKLNWQSSISFAEEGKRKAVVQYFDGSLQNRQTVTKDNSTQTVVVAETMYDQQGRPAIQVLPAPTLNSILKYNPKFNTAVNGAEYDKAQYDSLPAPEQFLSTTANPMGTGSGAANYYSPQNPDANAGISRFIPAADGYPFTETVYTPDNTGRISRVSGVGSIYKMRGRHETVYSYAGASQKELDAIFGTDAGVESHYFKNSVRDPNGQYSVAYLDMHGRTVATALAGSADSGRLNDLSSNILTTETETLNSVERTTFGNLELSTHKSQPVAEKGIYTFNYSLVPPVLKKKDCDGNDVCYIGKFDLQIKITDDAFNQLLGGSPVIKTFSNYNAGQIISDCTTPAPITLSFTLELEKGNYEIVKLLKINREAMEAYRNNVFLQTSVCTSLEKIIDQQRSLNPAVLCVPTCDACIANLGTYNQFAVAYLAQLSLQPGDSVSHRQEIVSAYAKTKESCDLLCNKVPESDMIRKAMLQDVTAPSGQYADPEATDFAYSIFHNIGETDTLRYQSAALQYLDEGGKPAMVYDEISGTMVRPQQLQPVQFAEKFQPSWANALVGLHPEYCKLLAYEKHKDSQLWDIDFSATDTYAEAKQKGYLNPTKGSFSGLGPLTGLQDPLVQENGGAYKSAIEGRMANYQNGKSIWAYSAVNALCGPGNTTCWDQYTSNDKVFNESTMCAGDLNMVWRSFRETYLTLKKEYVDNLIEQSTCPPGAAKVSAALLSQAGMVANFTTAVAAMTQNGYGYLNTGSFNEQAMLDSAQKALSQSYADNCNAYANAWMEQLAPCSYTSAQWAIIKAQLIAVCKEGSDLDHPLGSSSVPNSSSMANRSFEDVITKFNAANNISIQGCNGLLLTLPAPYYKQKIVVDKPVFSKPQDCECEKIAAMKKEFDIVHEPQENFSTYLNRTRKLKITQVVLDDMLNACNASGGCKYMDHAVKVPAAFQCFTPAPCVDCRVMATLYGQFISDYGITPTLPEEDTIQQKNNAFFANFMNNRLGFSLSAVDYLQFRATCLNSSYKDTTYGGAPTIAQYINSAAISIVDMKATRDGGFVLVGSTLNSGRSQDKALIIKVKANRDVEWAKTNDGGSKLDVFNIVNQTADGGFIAGGTSLNGVETNPNVGVATMIRYSAKGDVVWKKGLYTNSPTGDGIRDMIELSNGDIAYLGDYNVVSNACDVTGGVLDSNGVMKWHRRMGTNGSDMGQFMLADQDTLVMTMLTANSATYFNFGIIKLNRYTGAFYSAKNYNQDQKKTVVSGIFRRPEGGYRLTMTGAIGYSSASGQGAVVDINQNGAVTRAIKLDRLFNKDTYWLSASMMSDGSLLISPNVDEAVAGVHVMKMLPNGTFAWRRTLANKASNTFTRKTWLTGSNTIVSGGVFNDKAALFSYDINGKAACPDDTFALSWTNFPVNEVSLTWMVNGIESATTFNLPYTIADLPLTLNTSICTGNTIDSNSITIYQGPLLCGQSNPVFENIPIEEVNNCSDSSFALLNTATEIYKAVTDSLKDDFYDAYVRTCMNAVNNETFTMTHGLSEYQYTLYYYDQAGNLVKTIPPAGVLVDRTDTWLQSVAVARKNGTIKVPPHTMATKYRYNTLNQVVEQVSPDGGVSRFWYDRLGRLTVSQNAEQRKTKYYSYTLYDDLGRITEVGQITSPNDISNQISRSDALFKQWLAAVAASKTQITQTVYDQPYSPISGLFVARNLRNRVSWSAVYNNKQVMDTLGYSSATFYSYDIHGNVDTLLQDYKEGTLRIQQNRFKKLAYDYDLVSGKVNKASYQPGMQDAFFHRYIYDAENRLTNVETSTDDFYWEKDAFYQYYKHGPLAKAVIGQQQVQGLDYAYTLQGWLKGVNGSSLTPAFDMGNDGGSGSLIARDAFGFALHYYGDHDYKPIGTNANRFAAGTGSDNSIFTPLFNGNIAAMSVNLPAVGEPLLYAYRYDVLNRLNSMTTAKGLNPATNTWTPLKVPDFGETITYDENGNIQTYKRNGNQTFAGKPLGMDSLIYSYKPDNNQLDYINDEVNSANYSNDIDKQTPGNYVYDAIGNLIYDRGAGIDSIYWTVYGKIQRIKKADGTIITYTYDVAGNRISKRVKNIETWYVRDATGNVMGVYTSGDSSVNNGALSLIESALYGSSRLGIQNRQVNLKTLQEPVTVSLPGLGTGIITNFTRGEKVFELSNHLGNVLATVSDRKRPVSLNGTTTDHYDPLISTAQDYYPFGSLMPGRGGRVTTGGWASGTDNVNGYTVPADLSISNRVDNKPSEYVASSTITFTEGFTGGVGDNFTAYIADGSYTGGSGGGSGNVAGMSGGYRYGFNGKENDNEIKGEGNQQDYGFRIYDPRIGRFLSEDPLTKSYPELTPYQFASNSPIQGADFDGLELINNNKDPRFLKIVGGQAIFGTVMSTTVQKTVEYGAEMAVNRAGQLVAKEAVGAGLSRAALGGAALTVVLTAWPMPMGNPEGSQWWQDYTHKPLNSSARTFTDDNNSVYSVLDPEKVIEKLSGRSPLRETFDGYSDADKDKDVILYRGVHAKHPDLPNARLGMAIPWGLNGGHSSPTKHNENENYSIFTSWTLSDKIAKGWATERGLGGVLLTKKFKLSQLVPSPDRFDELEVLVPGVVTGAKVDYPK